MQRMIGLLLLTIGTGLAAVFGAWLPGSERDDHRARMAAEAHLDMAKVVKRAQAKAVTDQDHAGEARLAALAAKPAPASPLGADGKTLSPPRGTASVSLWAEEAGLPFGAGVLLVIIGVVLARRGIREEAHAAHADTASSGGAPGPLLAKLAVEVAELKARHGGADPVLETVRADVERLQKELVTPLVEGREQISQEFGVGAYADVFVPFSAAERQLNRIWSACVDGYIDEIAPCLVRAEIAANQAHEAYGQVSAAHAG